jgi:hypothetical protein
VAEVVRLVGASVASDGLLVDGRVGLAADNEQVAILAEGRSNLREVQVTGLFGVGLELRGEASALTNGRVQGPRASLRVQGAGPATVRLGAVRLEPLEGSTCAATLVGEALELELQDVELGCAVEVLVAERLAAVRLHSWAPLSLDSVAAGRLEDSTIMGLRVQRSGLAFSRVVVGAQATLDSVDLGLDGPVQLDAGLRLGAEGPVRLTGPGPLVALGSAAGSDVILLDGEVELGQVYVVSGALRVRAGRFAAESLMVYAAEGTPADAVSVEAGTLTAERAVFRAPPGGTALHCEGGALELGVVNVDGRGGLAGGQGGTGIESTDADLTFGTLAVRGFEGAGLTLGPLDAFTPGQTWATENGVGVVADPSVDLRGVVSTGNGVDRRICEAGVCR